MVSRLSDSTSTHCLLFSSLERRPVSLLFDQVQGSRDAGAVLLAAANRRYGGGLLEGLALWL